MAGMEFVSAGAPLVVTEWANPITLTAAHAPPGSVNGDRIMLLLQAGWHAWGGYMASEHPGGVSHDFVSRGRAVSASAGRLWYAGTSEGWTGSPQPGDDVQRWAVPSGGTGASYSAGGYAWSPHPGNADYYERHYEVELATLALSTRRQSGHLPLTLTIEDHAGAAFTPQPHPAMPQVGYGIRAQLFAFRESRYQEGTVGPGSPFGGFIPGSATEGYSAQGNQGKTRIVAYVTSQLDFEGEEINRNDPAFEGEWSKLYEAPPGPAGPAGYPAHGGVRLFRLQQGLTNYFPASSAPRFRYPRLQFSSTPSWWLGDPTARGNAVDANGILCNRFEEAVIPPDPTDVFRRHVRGPGLRREHFIRVDEW